MKNFLLILLAAFLSVPSCKKNDAVTNTPKDEIQLKDALMITQGKLVFNSEKGGAGIVKIFKQTNGRQVLSFEQMTLNGHTDFEIYFSKSADGSGAGIKLFSIKNINGNYQYLLPASINVQDFSFVLITNDQAGTVASAFLN